MRKIIYLLVSAFFICSLSAYAGAEDNALQEGRKIMEEVNARNQCAYETTNVKMEIIDKRGTKRIRRLMIYAKRDKGNALQTLIRFSAPEDVKGTGLLTLERKDREDDQWLYLPILRKNKRIAEGSKKNSFVGTDFTFEDLRPESLKIHDYRLLSEETLDEAACFVIEAVPVKEEQGNSGYKSRKIWVRKDIYIPVKIEYTDTQGKYLKTESRSNIVKLQEGIWRADFILMDNQQNSQKTTLDVQKRDIENKISDSKFTQVELEQGWE